MMRIYPVALALTAAFSSLGFAQDAADAVTLSAPDFNAERAAVRIVITNHARQAITAWEVAIRVIYADGVERGHSRAREAYPVAAGLTEAKDRLIPAGGSVETWFYLPRTRTTPLMTVTPTLRWAVFADKSAIGDPLGIKQAFAGRDRDRRAWSTVLQALNLAIIDVDRAHGLRKALDRLNDRSQEDFEHAVKRTMRRNIERVLEQRPEAQEYFITHWSTVSRRYVDEATRHGSSGVVQLP